MKYLPRVDSKREYESPIHEYRVAAGLTIRELAIQAGVSAEAISSLANGMRAPVTKLGQLTKSARKLCDFFSVGPEELFPRYICSLDQSYKFEIEPYEMWSEYAAEDHADRLLRRFYARQILRASQAHLTPRQKKYLTLCVFESHTLAEAASIEGVSYTRAKQILEITLRRLRLAAAKINRPL
jgi:transcriptional regulator with XRE-family HTH domain